MLLSTHGPPVRAGHDRLLDQARDLPAGAAFEPPGRELVDALLAVSHG